MTQHTEPDFWPRMRQLAQERAERIAAEEAALPKRPGSRSAVCGTCGYVLSRAEARCPRHREADLYEWKNAHTVGRHLLRTRFEQGLELERWIEDGEDSDFKGTSRTVCAWLLSMGLNHWGWFDQLPPARERAKFNPLFESSNKE